MGPTVNVTARIESTATPGTVYASAAVKEHLPESAYAFVGNFKMTGLEQALVKLLENAGY